MCACERERERERLGHSPSALVSVVDSEMDPVNPSELKLLAVCSELALALPMYLRREEREKNGRGTEEE